MDRSRSLNILLKIFLNPDSSSRSFGLLTGS
ncbi:hypothetical protein GECvBGOT_gp007c [Salmonella phage GEC_vB_GOT]|nr:hypothetical protein GECvBGOT_gp007c [Salmonella phage GEC_vB_GOT]